MALTATIPAATKSTLGLDSETEIRVYVPPGAAIPGGVRAVVTIPLTSGLTELVDISLAAVPFTGTGATNALKAWQVQKEIVAYARSVAGYT